MHSQKQTNLFSKKDLNNNKQIQIFRFCSSIYSDCHSTHGDLNDKKNIKKLE